MPLTQCSLTATLAWVLSRANTGFQATTQGRDSRSFNLAALSLSSFNQPFAAEYVIPQALTAPVQSNASAISGGSLSDSTTYYWVITATTSFGETVVSNEKSLAISGSNQTATLTWGAVTGAAGYKVYRSTSSGTYGATSLVTTIGSGATVTCNDTGTALVSGTPPASNTSATQVTDFSSFVNLVNETVTPGHALTLIVLPAGARVTISPGATNGLQWFFGGTSHSITVTAGGLQLYSEPVAGPGKVIDGTHKILTFANPDATTLTLDVAMIVGP